MNGWTVIVAMVICVCVGCALWPANEVEARLQRAMDTDTEAVMYYSHVASLMTLTEFKRIRAVNKIEKEDFGDGTNAPYWPQHSWNSSGTLHRGVWCDDAYPVPSNEVLDKFREDYRRAHPELTTFHRPADAPKGFTLQPGESVTIEVPITIK